jgi:3-phenylpropionate/trans-cinnamate dioxygenase ferredoxin reductase component
VPLDASTRVVVVGASTAGLTTAEALRHEGFEGPITLVGDETRLPYRRPPLSKQVLTGEWPPERTYLLDDKGLDDLDLRLMLGSRASELDVAAHTLVVDGDLVPYDILIVATGVKARQLPDVDDAAGVHTLRTLDDVVALHAGLGTAARVAVVGAGVLGSEIASAARRLGLEVVLVGRTRTMRFGQVGDHLSDLIEGLHRANEVDVRTGVDVIRVFGTDRHQAVALSTGQVVEADLVIVAIGGIPSTDWLVGSGLDLSDGVVCDACGLAAPDVYAVGDVAQWRQRARCPVPRAEHHLNAVEQALAVAHLLVTGESPGAVVPFFWSELHDTRIQAYGRFAAHSPLETIAGDMGDRRFVAASRDGDRTTGVVGWNMPRDFRDARALVDASTPPPHQGVPS